MRNGDMVAAALLWEEAELGHKNNLQLFGLILPRLTFLSDTLSRHGFNKNPAELNEEELAMVQHIGAAAVCLGQAERYSCRNLGELGAKVVAEAMTTNSVTYELDLGDNNMGDAGAKALAESLKTNSSLGTLWLGGNYIGAAGALALAAGLLQNRGLRRLWLSDGCGGDEGRRALEDAEKTKKECGEDFEILWW